MLVFSTSTYPYLKTILDLADLRWGNGNVASSMLQGDRDGDTLNRGYG